MTQAADRIDRAAMLAELKRDEGWREKPYRCSANKLTIGFGRNLEDCGISKAEGELLLGNDVDSKAAELDRALPWWRELDGVRQRVLLNMAFNLGLAKLLGFRNTLAAVRERRFEDAARGMEASLWYKQVGERARRLAAMMRTGRV
jgi:lysozyme